MGSGHYETVFAYDEICDYALIDGSAVEGVGGQVIPQPEAV